MKNCPEIVQIKMSNLDQTNDDIKKVEENNWIFFDNSEGLFFAEISKANGF